MGRREAAKIHWPMRSPVPSAGEILPQRQVAQIMDTIDKAGEQIAKGGSLWRGMSYEEGVRNALEWVLWPEDNPPPMEDD